MAVKKKQVSAPKQKNCVTIQQTPDESQDAAVARAMMQPETQAAVTIQQWQGGATDVDELTKELKRQTDKLKTSDMHRAESILLAQAQSLDELFNNLARKAHGQEYLSSYESFLKLALKAQNQCRMTLETLSNIKNPPVLYAKQANIAHGPQQINNAVAAKNEIEPIKEFRGLHGETLVTRSQSETIGSNSAMAALA